MTRLDEKLTPAERDAFYDHSSPRVVGIMLPAIVENHLTALLRDLMRPEKRVISQMFGPSGPLGPFATKIQMAYLLRVIGEETHADLIAVTKIRNKFAHDVSVADFDNQQISGWVKGMHVYRVLTEVERSARRHRGSKQIRLALKAQLLEDALESTRDSFRECLRLLIHQIVDIERLVNAERGGIVLMPATPPSAN